MFVKPPVTVPLAPIVVVTVSRAWLLLFFGIPALQMPSIRLRGRFLQHGTVHCVTQGRLRRLTLSMSCLLEGFA